MIGITLSSEQIRTAPAEVRRWIEAEVSASLGLPAPAVAKKPQQGQLAACSAEEVAAILAQVQGVLPVVNVLFEFGRRGAVIGPSRVEAFRLLDIAQHTRSWAGYGETAAHNSALSTVTATASSPWKPRKTSFICGRTSLPASNLDPARTRP